MTAPSPLPPPTAKVQALLQQGMNLQRAGRPAEAERAFAEAHRLEPRRFDVLHLMGMAAVQRKDMAAATDCFRRAARLAPQIPALQVNLGNALTEDRRFGEALEAFDRALAIDGRIADAWNGRGAALKGLGALGAALTAYGRAAEIDPNNVHALCNLGGLLGNLGRPKEALAAYDRAVAIAPQFAEAHSGRARTNLLLGAPLQALSDAERALVLRPTLAEAHANLGFALESLGRHADAVRAYNQAKALDPDLPVKFLSRGLVLAELGHTDEAVISFESCLALDDTIAEAHVRVGQAKMVRAPELSLASFDRALELQPDHDEARCLSLSASMACCEWLRTEGGLERMTAAIERGRAVNVPFVFLSVSSSPADQKRNVQLWSERFFPATAKPLARGPYRHDRLRVGYFSADFHDHATAWLAAAVWEAHDRDRYEISAISVDAAPEDGMRQRLRRAFDHFLDVGDLDDRAIAQLIRDREIDILVDLKGYTAFARPGIFAARAAPIQAQWLGYPGTMGATYFDYVLADAQVIPPGDEKFFTEQVVRLPGSYQPNDPSRPIGPRPGREALGLPEGAFVFCCFNAAYKIAPAIFEVWMRLLSATPGSVLWLLQDNPLAERNLRREAQARGIDPTRLVFAPRTDQTAHLGRLQAADLVLDTLPYGAHTTASDALWAGVPVLTCYGEAFPGRVGASLLTAVGLPELIAPDLDAYEAMALGFARDPGRLAALKARLAAQRLTAPLFDAKAFALALERAFDQMQARRRDGRAAQGFDVAASTAVAPA